MYYGTEQGYAGGNDPNNREQLWTNFDPNHPMYTFLKIAVAYRRKMEVWKLDYVERFVDHNFYAFSRGQVLVVTTNSELGQIKHSLEYHPFRDGDVVCDVFWGDKDCVTVSGGKVEVTQNNGEVKVFVLKSELISVD